jgi:hypothetical protein
MSVQTHDIDASPAIQEEHSDGFHEETPLLPPDGNTEPRDAESQAIIPTWENIWPLIPFSRQIAVRAWSAIVQNKLIIIPTVTAVALLTTIIVVSVFYAETIFNQALHFSLGGFDILNMTDTGASLKVKGTIVMDYSHIHWFHKAIVYPLTLLLGVVTVIQTEEPLGVFAELPQNPGTGYKNPASVYFPTLDIDLTPGSIKGIEMNITVNINPIDVVKLHEDYILLKEYNGVRNLIVYGVFQGRFSLKKLISLGEYYARVEDSYELKAHDAWNFTRFTLDSYVLDVGENGFNGSVQITTDMILSPVTFSIGQIEWEAVIPGCSPQDQNKLQFTSLVTDVIKFSGYRPTVLRANVTTPHLSNALEKKCSNGISPFNRLIKSLMESQGTLFLHAKMNSQINAQLPSWLYFVLMNVAQPFTFSLSEFVDTEHPLHYDVLKNRLSIPNDAAILPELSSNIVLNLDLPAVNDNHQLFNLKGVFGDIYLLFEGKIILKVYLHSWQEVETDGPFLNFLVQGAKIDITDNTIVSFLLDEYLHGEDFEMYVMAKADIDMQTSISSKVLQQIEWNTTIPIQGSKDLLDGMSAQLHELAFVTSKTSAMLRLIANLELRNPVDISVDLQFLSVNIIFNNTVIGDAKVTDTSIPADALTNLTSILTLNPLSSEARCAIEELISLYISGREPEIVVEGHEGSCKIPAIAAILSRLSVPFKMPSFQHEDSDQKGFILGITFHVLSSKVQITAYNPIINELIVIRIKEAKVFSEDVEIASIQTGPLIILRPGMSTTEGIPVTIAQGVAKDILRKAINRNLTLHTNANFDLSIREFTLNLDYEGEDVDSEIKL